MSRHKDVAWNLPEGRPGTNGMRVHEWESIHAAILMDIRDELKNINRRLNCPDTMAMPRYLKLIARNTAKPVSRRRRRAFRRITRRIAWLYAAAVAAVAQVRHSLTKKKKKRRGVSTRKLP